MGDLIKVVLFFDLMLNIMNRNGRMIYWFMVINFLFENKVLFILFKNLGKLNINNYFVLLVFDFVYVCIVILGLIFGL